MYGPKDPENLQVQVQVREVEEEEEEEEEEERLLLQKEPMATQ
jgi:hypothetical protein